MKLNHRLKERLKSRYGPWAIVTGASSGIGKELTKALAFAGLNVVLVSRSKPQLETVSALIQANYNVQSKVVAADLSTPNGNQKLIDSCKDLKVGLLVVNAGFATSGPFIENGINKELGMVFLNCISLATLTHYYAKEFKSRSRGGIVLISSLLGFQGAPYAANYAATKAYVQSLGEGLAVELEPHGVDVLTAAPGPVNTGFADRANMNIGKAQKPQDMVKPILSSLGKRPTVLPGTLTKFLMYSLSPLPRAFQVKVMTGIMKKMTHQS